METLSAPRLSARSVATRRVVRCNAEVATTVRTPVTVANEAPAELDVDAMHKRLEARAKAMIQLEERDIANRTTVKFVLKQKVGLGEAWKIVGKCPELGNMIPEVSPVMVWGSGDVWTLELKVRSGNFPFKAVLRKPNGQYLWENGPDRKLEVPYGEPKLEVAVDKITFPPA